MKTHTTTLLLALVAITTATLADTPDAILTDYRAKAAPAMEKVNTTLERATVPIIADLVKAGDTAGADEVKAQLKAKQDGEPVAKPHAKAASLFALYDSARLKALEPAQAAAIRRIDALLASSDGKKLEIVDAAKTVRAEIEAGKAPVQAPKIPVEWTYHNSEEQRVVMASVRFLEDGTFEMTNTQPGKWKANKAGNQITVTFKDRSTWKITLNSDTAVIDRPDIGQRYLRLKSQPETATVAK